MKSRALIISALIAFALLLVFNRVRTPSSVGGSPPPGIKLGIQPVQHVSPRPELSPGTNTYSFEIFIAELHDHDLARLGLTQLFETPQAPNELQANSVEESGVMHLKRQFTNVHVLPSNPHFFAGKLSTGDAETLLTQFRASAGIDLLMPPKFRTFAGREGRIAVQSPQNILISPPSGPPLLQLTTITNGTDLTLVASPTADGMLLEFTGRHESFAGYSNAAPQVTGDLRLILFAYGLRAELLTNEVLLLGTPIHEHVVNTVERTRYLSDIPLLGDSFFTKRRVQTNRLRQVTILRQVQE